MGCQLSSVRGTFKTNHTVEESLQKKLSLKDGPANCTGSESCANRKGADTHFYAMILASHYSCCLLTSLIESLQRVKVPLI